MKVIQRSTKQHVLRFDSGDDVLSLLGDYCSSCNIFAGSFQAIGAACEVRLSWYDTDTKSYVHQDFQGKWEIVSLTGNASMKDGNIHMHAHGCISNELMEVKGGHISLLKAHPTCEMVFTVLPEVMTRSLDERCGLHLLV